MRSIPATGIGSLPPRSIAPAKRTRAADRYVIKEEIASGGMGVVYRVFDRAAGEERALKRIKQSVAERPYFVEAFEREYQVLAGLDHPRIIRVFDYGLDEDGPYYTMELLAGEDLRASAPLPYQLACSYLRDLATSLALLHARRMIHRDLSPGNVRRSPDGHCKLFDFGALTGFGYTREIVGTPPAIPPESVHNAPLDHRADLYQLGALAYWMLTNRQAYAVTRIDDLPNAWLTPPPAPSELVPEIPAELDLLVLALLSHEPVARPASAAEVIARLEVIGSLAPEADGDVELLAQSFLLNPRFIGRTAQLAELRRRTESALRGSGSAVLVEAASGMGRTRFLEEVGVRAQLGGAHVVRVDASVVRHAGGTLRALAVRLLDAFPVLAREEARTYRSTLLALGQEVETRLGTSGSSPPAGAGRESSPDGAQSLEGWFAQLARAKPLVIQVDNVEFADDLSLGVLAGLAKLAPENPLMVVLTQSTGGEQRPRVGANTLRGSCERVTLSGLDAAETLELARSLFGDAPNVERFSEWLHGRTAGSPLHCLEISRQLVRKGVIRYAGGMWLLPVERPDAELPAALEDALASRLDLLSEPARGLAEGLSLQRERPTLDLCRLLVGAPGEINWDDRAVLGLLDELTRHDVLRSGDEGYSFSSSALREAVLAKMDEARRTKSHARLGEAFALIAGDGDHALRIEAGWHLIRGGDELRGADMIALVTSNSVAVRTLIANLRHVGKPLEAALKVYRRHRRSVYSRAPLLAALAHSSYYEDRAWGERYGDEALDTLEHVAGLRLARFFARFVGRHLGLVAALMVALTRFYLEPRRDRPYSFPELLVQLFGAVTTLTGAAAMSLDVGRAARVAEVLEPFSVLPERATPVGIYQFCRSLEQIGRDHQASAYQVFDELIRRFGNPRWYPTLPPDARLLYLTGSHFARGAFAVFRDDGRAALESADYLDTCGLKLYAMIASALRFLYFTNRGEFAKAAPHREQVELHAAKVGSAWQVELWEPPALIPVYTALSDLVELTRICDRLEVSSKQIPSLEFYKRLAHAARALVRNESPWAVAQMVVHEQEMRGPRSFVGWAAVCGFVARAYNQHGSHAAAKKLCLEALTHTTAADHEYVVMFLNLEVQLAHAEGGLGDAAAGLARIDGLLERYERSDHPAGAGQSA